MSLRGISTALVLIFVLSIGLLLGVGIFDPLQTTVAGFNPDNMGAINNIHEVMVKWLVPVGLGTILLWAVLWILREERQTVR